MSLVHRLSDSWLARIASNKALREHNFHGVTSYSEDYDVPLAYETYDDTLELCHVRRITVMSNKLAAASPKVYADEFQFHEYCITAVHLHYDNAEHYFEKRDYGPTHDLVHTNEITPVIHAVVAGFPEHGVNTVKQLLTIPTSDDNSRADITYDWTIRHELPTVWHNITDFITPRIIAISDIGGFVNKQRDSFTDVMFVTYTVKVTIFYCLR